MCVAVVRAVSEALVQGNDGLVDGEAYSCDSKRPSTMPGQLFVSPVSYVYFSNRHG